MDRAAQEAWLAANTMACQRLAARITPAACAEYRATNSGHVYNMPNLNRTITIPGCCNNCPGLTDTPLSEEPIMSSVKECDGCHRIMSIRGRGLCAKCFSEAEKAGVLPPAKANGRPPATMKALSTQIAADKARNTTAPLDTSPKQTMTTDQDAVQTAMEEASQAPSFSVILHFMPGDKPLYERLLATAFRERRAVDQQILRLLEDWTEA